VGAEEPAVTATGAASVADARGRRGDAATGVLAAILLLVGFIIPGAPPDPGDPVAKIAAYLSDHRSSILAGDVLIALGGAAFIWFLGSLRSYLRAGEGGEGRLSAASLLAGGVAIAGLLAGIGVQSALVLHPGTLADPAIVRAGFDAYNAMITISGAPLAVAAAAASCSGARSGALPPSVYWSGSVVAVLQLVTLVALFAKSGFFAAGMGLTVIAFIAVGAWYIAVALLIVRRAGVPPVARAAP
jgi:hypothetical protein